MTKFILPLDKIKKIIKSNKYEGYELKCIGFRSDVGMKKMSIFLQLGRSQDIIIESEERFDVTCCNLGGRVDAVDKIFQMVELFPKDGMYKHIIKRLSLKKNNRFEVILNNNNDLFISLGIVCHELRLHEDTANGTTHSLIDVYVGKEDNNNSPLKTIN